MGAQCSADVSRCATNSGCHTNVCQRDYRFEDRNTEEEEENQEEELSWLSGVKLAEAAGKATGREASLTPLRGKRSPAPKHNLGEQVTLPIESKQQVREPPKWASELPSFQGQRSPTSFDVGFAENYVMLEGSKHTRKKQREPLFVPPDAPWELVPSSPQLGDPEAFEALQAERRYHRYALMEIERRERQLGQSDIPEICTLDSPRPPPSFDSESELSEQENRAPVTPSALTPDPKESNKVAEKRLCFFADEQDSRRAAEQESRITATPGPLPPDSKGSYHVPEKQLGFFTDEQDSRRAAEQESRVTATPGPLPPDSKGSYHVPEKQLGFFTDDQDAKRAVDQAGRDPVTPGYLPPDSKESQVVVPQHLGFFADDQEEQVPALPVPLSPGEKGSRLTVDQQLDDPDARKAAVQENDAPVPHGSLLVETAGMITAVTQQLGKLGFFANDQDDRRVVEQEKLAGVASQMAQEAAAQRAKEERLAKEAVTRKAERERLAREAAKKATEGRLEREAKLGASHDAPELPPVWIGTPTPQQAPQPQIAEAEARNFEGHWSKARIEGTTLTWNKEYGGGTIKILVRDKNNFTMRTGDGDCHARLIGDRLQWSDGEVWHKIHGELVPGDLYEASPGNALQEDGIDYYRSGDRGRITAVETEADGTGWVSIMWERTGHTTSYPQSDWFANHTRVEEIEQLTKKAGDERLAREAAQQKAEKDRLALEAKKKAEEEKAEKDRKALEAKKKAEEEKLAREAAQQKAEKDRLALEAKKKAEEEKAEKDRKALEAKKKVEEEKLAREAAQQKAEKDRLALEAKKKAEEEKAEKDRKALEAKKKADEEKLAREAAQQKAEKDRLAVEAKKKAEEEQRVAEAAAKEEEARKAQAAADKMADEKRRTEEARLSKEASAKKAAAKGKSSPASSQSQARTALLQSAAGVWLASADLKPKATIKGSQIYWSKAFNAQPSKLAVQSDGKISLTLKEEEHVVSLVRGAPNQLKWKDGTTWTREELQGRWQSEQDKKLVGEIKGGKLYWDQSFNMPEPTPVSGVPVYPRGSVKMTLGGAECTAVYELGNVAKLRWSDGEVWERVSSGFSV